MAEAVQSTQQEFWSPPSHNLEDLAVKRESPSIMAEVCRHCGTEFLFGSYFCHSCGGRRPEAMSSTTMADAAEMAGLWEHAVHRVGGMVSAVSISELSRKATQIEFPAWMQYLHFHEIKKRTALSTGSFIAFLIGLGCVAGALLVGLLTAKTLVDWQAIQFYRAEWLLKKPTDGRD